VGAGPAGLTCAKDLALRGYAVTVYEELPEPGGMLRWAIPAYRLPRDIIKKEIDAISALGVKIVCNTRVGKDISFPQLENEYAKIYLAPGAQRSQPMGVEGENLAGVYGGVEFLREVNLNEQAWLTGVKSVGASVAVVGGGNSAIDAARVAKRLGADVTILYRRLKQDMPAAAEEIHAAEEEGIKIELLVAPLKITGNAGQVSEIICQRMELGDFDNSGRKRPVAIKGSEFSLKVDTIISAIGQVPDMTFVSKESGIAVNKWDCFDIVKGSKTQTTNAQYYAGGDAVTGPDTVIAAIGAGHKAAAEMDAAIRIANGEPAYEAPAEEKIDVPLIIDEETAECPQTKMPELVLERRVGGFDEVELGFTKELAFAEACRCLRCDAEV
jgi:NADPH-dependent glutamate synthase beta subunit-like oxidoreductase